MGEGGDAAPSPVLPQGEAGVTLTVLGGVGDKALEAPGKGGSEDTAEMSGDLLVGGYGPGVP